jgi:hypothetical protein
MTPGTLAMTVFSNQIEVALENPERINYWIVAGVIAVLVTLTFAARRWMLKQEAEWLAWVSRKTRASWPPQRYVRRGTAVDDFRLAASRCNPLSKTPSH